MLQVTSGKRYLRLVGDPNDSDFEHLDSASQ